MNKKGLKSLLIYSALQSISANMDYFDNSPQPGASRFLSRTPTAPPGHGTGESGFNGDKMNYLPETDRTPNNAKG